MCDNCKGTCENEEVINKVELSEEEVKKLIECAKELETETDEEDEGSSEKYDKDEIIYYVDPLIMSTENLAEDIEFEKYAFKRGIEDASYYAGLYITYINSGMSNIDAYALVMLDKQKEISMKITEMNNKTSIEVSKNQLIQADKNSL